MTGPVVEVRTATRSAALPPEPTLRPEPSSWAMLMAGFGGIGAMLRRRNCAPPGRMTRPAASWAGAAGFAFPGRHGRAHSRVTCSKWTSLAPARRPGPWIKPEQHDTRMISGRVNRPALKRSILWQMILLTGASAALASTSGDATSLGWPGRARA
ncbi:PEPxxWA-CTERM sorting domain-containing protein [Sandarakinorhabdus sp.]|uniref:PEPxxWA-CTERM sorting domain-containing protein n=1 Tax=Sandarakinorhabdus sp. TaxID=1916663 RepID=UPI0033424140